MAPALPLLLAITLGVQAQGEAGLHAEGRGRRVSPAPTPREESAVDLSIAPRLHLRLRQGVAALEVSYSPTFTTRDVGPDVSYDQMQEGELRLVATRPGAYRVAAFAGGAAGRTDLLTLSRTAGATENGAGVITTTQAVHIERLRAGLELSARLDRRSEVLASGGATVEGGVDATARANVPVVRWWESTGEYRWSATHLDRVGLRLHGLGARVASRRIDSGVVEGMVKIHHQASRELELWVGAGAVRLVSRMPDAGSTFPRRSHLETHAAGEMGLVLAAAPADPGTLDSAAAGARPVERRAGISADALVHLGGNVDRLTGVAAQELDGTASLRWPMGRGLALLLRGSGMAIWPDSGRTRRAQVDLGAARAFSEHFSVDAGFYGTRQLSDDPNLPDYSEYGAFVGLSLNSLPRTF